MGYETVNFFYLSEIIDLPVISGAGSRKIGRVVDLAASTGQVYPRITGLITKLEGKKEPEYIPWSAVLRATERKNILVAWEANGDTRPSENEILLKKSFLDKQLISTTGSKLIRVNDLQLLIDNSSKEKPNLWLVHIDIGTKGLLRRLGWERIANSIFRWLIGRDMRDVFVSWKNVQPTTTTNVYGSLHLKTDSSKLSEMHPADLADIFEDLGTDERNILIESLAPPAAAATLQEMPLRLRAQIAEGLETDKLAVIVNEMQMDEIVDLIDELPPERRTALFQHLSVEKVTDIKELVKIAAHRVGSIMNTNFITARTTDTVAAVLDLIKRESDSAELIYYVYILDNDEHLKGIVTLRHLLTADEALPMADLMRENVMTVDIDASIKSAAQIFFKYHFDALPVIDEAEKIQGIITLRDTLERVFPEVREESKG